MAWARREERGGAVLYIWVPPPFCGSQAQLPRKGAGGDAFGAGAGRKGGAQFVWLHAARRAAGRAEFEGRSRGEGVVIRGWARRMTRLKDARTTGRSGGRRRQGAGSRQTPLERSSTRTAQDAGRDSRRFGGWGAWVGRSGIRKKMVRG
ncbi:uncharacterized protein A4U43_C01F5720 [Asparagus officinalis]|uniref:Uncharacterized protein n=1 Tax=Asparagus officinalis TaxID=4686 RepID=A0A5P1FM32_ASPOF|nr:uncharacterized protein A4U43_C01F5720 [Asparagus officinalis]